MYFAFPIPIWLVNASINFIACLPHPHYIEFRVLHESLYGYVPQSPGTPNAGNGELNQQQLPPFNHAAVRPPIDNLDAELAMALRISEQEQKLLQEQLKREQEELEEVLRLSMEDK